MTPRAGILNGHFYGIADSGTFTISHDEPTTGFTTLAFTDKESKSLMVVPTEQFILAGRTYLGA